jgi:tetratricopeptide (TPR) repeat protein
MNYYRDGCNMIFTGDYKGAVNYLTLAIERDSDFLQAWENRGVAKYHLKSYREALEDFSKALEINPSDYNTFGRRGWTRFRLYDCQGAITDFTTALRGDPENPGYYCARGQAKYYLKDLNGALSDFGKTIRYGAGRRKIRGTGFYWRGLTLIELGDKKGGCSDLHKAAGLGYDFANEMIGIYCSE